MAIAAAAFVAAPATAGSGDVRARPAFPASALVLAPTATVRSDPSASSRRIAVFPQFRKDFRPTVVQVLSRTRAGGTDWLQVSVPGRPNGRRGWVAAPLLHVRPVTRWVVVDLSARRLRVVEHRRTRFATRVAVGRRGAETPTGLFYVTAVFRPTERYLGSYAFETSAYSKLSEWPGGGIVGLHGTNEPELLGRAVSHGCIRMSNAAAQVLKRLAPAGTPLRIVR
jgi:lipoprotein-anchoring transpeptidase ErfK/SrfK